MKRHFDFIDTAKGIGAFMVMLSHIDKTPAAYHIFIAPIFLSVFFYVSGLFLNAEKYETLFLFLKEKISKLLIPWIIISYVSAIFNLSTIREILNDPKAFFIIFINTSHRILIGKSIWFVPCLILSLLISYILFYLIKNKKIVFLCSLTIFILAILFAREQEYTVWSVNTALVNQFFVVLGAVTGNELLLKQEKIKRYNIFIMVVVIIVYSCSLYFFYHENLYSGFGIRLNIYNNVISYMILNYLGIMLAIFISATFSKIPLITFMGSHSLFYFAFGAHGYRVGRILLDLLENKFSVMNELISNQYFSSLFICIIASVFMGILAKPIDYLMPVLNGKMELGPILDVVFRRRKIDKKDGLI